MKVLFFSAAFLVAVKATFAADYLGEIEKITEPILLKLAPHSTKAVSTKQFLLTVDGISRELRNERQEYSQIVTEKGEGFHFSANTGNSKDATPKEFRYSMDVDAKGVATNIEGLNISNEEEKQLIVNTLASSLTCLSNVEIRTGTIICKRDSKKLIEHLGKKIDLNNANLPEESAYEVEGWTTHKGKKVIIASYRIPTVINTIKNIKVPMNSTGYQLIDPQTAAILFSTTTSMMEGEAEGRKFQFEIKESMDVTYQ